MISDGATAFATSSKLNRNRTCVTASIGVPSGLWIRIAYSLIEPARFGETSSVSFTPPTATDWLNFAGADAAALSCAISPFAVDVWLNTPTAANTASTSAISATTVLGSSRCNEPSCRDHVDRCSSVPAPPCWYSPSITETRRGFRKKALTPAIASSGRISASFASSTFPYVVSIIALALGTSTSALKVPVANTAITLIPAMIENRSKAFAR